MGVSAPPYASIDSSERKGYVARLRDDIDRAVTALTSPRTSFVSTSFSILHGEALVARLSDDEREVAVRGSPCSPKRREADSRPEIDSGYRSDDRLDVAAAR